MSATTAKATTEYSEVLECRVSIGTGFRSVLRDAKLIGKVMEVGETIWATPIKGTESIEAASLEAAVKRLLEIDDKAKRVAQRKPADPNAAYLRKVTAKARLRNAEVRCRDLAHKELTSRTVIVARKEAAVTKALGAVSGNGATDQQQRRINQAERELRKAQRDVESTQAIWDECAAEVKTYQAQIEQMKEDAPEGVEFTQAEFERAVSDAKRPPKQAKELQSA